MYTEGKWEPNTRTIEKGSGQQCHETLNFKTQVNALHTVVHTYWGVQVSRDEKYILDSYVDKLGAIHFKCLISYNFIVLHLPAESRRLVLLERVRDKAQHVSPFTKHRSL